MLYEEERARDDLEFDPLPLSPWVATHPEIGIVVKVHYSEPLSRLLRSIPRGKWDPSNKRWIYPFVAGPDIRKAMPEIDRLASCACSSSESDWDKEIVPANIEDPVPRRDPFAHPRALRTEYLSPVNDRIFHLEIEAIGDDMARTGPLTGFRSRAWVAQIFGIDGQGRPVRAFLTGYRDYLNANSKGSRGVKLCYSLRGGPIYQVSSPQSWHRTERYYLRIIHSQPFRMTNEEFYKCLAK